MFGVGSIFSMSTPVSFFKAADQIARQQGHVVFLTRCFAVKITAFNLLGFFPRTGFSRFLISCINAAKQRNKPALFMASYRAGPGCMLRAFSIARSAFASQWVFESEFFLVKKRPHITTRLPIDLGKSFRSGSG